MPIKPNYVYTISYRVNVKPDSTENLKAYGAITSIQEFSGGKATGYSQNSTARNQTDGWETVTFDFITSSNAETIRIDIMYTNNPGTVLWDDFSITEKEAYEPVLLDAKYDHGGTEDTANENNVIPNSNFDGGVIQGWSPKEGIDAGTEEIPAETEQEMSVAGKIEGIKFHGWGCFLNQTILNLLDLYLRADCGDTCRSGRQRTLGQTGCGAVCYGVLQTSGCITAGLCRSNEAR